MSTTTPSINDHAIAVNDHAIAVWNGKITLHVKAAGAGSPILYLHPAAGLAWDPFLTSLSERHTIYTPEMPGTSAGDPHTIHQVDDLHDLVLIYEEAIRRLGLSEAPVAIGQSFGGMLAAELGAHFPDLFAKLVLLDPIGLWREDAPLANWIEAAPTELPQMLFHDPDGPAAKAMFTPPEDPEAAIATQSGLVWALGCTGKFVWPIPERGLHKRLHRITAPTLIVWGENDRLNPVGYAYQFGEKIQNSRVVIIPDCGHIPQVEKLQETLEVVRDFLGDI
jgi:pimeloyl-ACP methyl ester carboxylesterase